MYVKTKNIFKNNENKNSKNLYIFITFLLNARGLL